MIGSQTNSLAIWILVAVWAIVVFVMVSVVGNVVTAESRMVGRRIGFILGKKEEVEEKNGKVDKNNVAKLNLSSAGIFTKLGSMIEDELKKSNVLMKPEEFALMWVVIALGPAFLALVFTQNIALPPILFGIGAVGPVIYLKHKQSKRMKVFESQLSDALMICGNCLRSGLTFTQAMENIADEMDDPISTEFKRVVNEIAYGSSQDEALEAMAARLNSPDLTMVVSAVNVQRQTGGNLSEILDIIGNTIRERIKIRGEISSLTAQGRMSGLIIGCMPILILLALCVINFEYISMFFYTSIGHMLLLLCLVLEVAGFALINKIVSIKF